MNTNLKIVPSITAATISPIAIIILYCVFINKGTIATPMVSRDSIIEVISNPLTALIQGYSITTRKNYSQCHSMATVPLITSLSNRMHSLSWP